MQELICLFAGLSAISIAVPASSTVVVPLTLEAAAKAADLAFAGTVTSIKSEKLGDNTSIVTKVTFGDVTYAKGTTRGKSVTITLAGGRVGTELIAVDGVPTFNIGERYVLLATGDLGARSNGFLPIVGVWQGFFPVRPDKSHGRPSVHDWNYRPLARVVDGKVHAVGDQVGINSTNGTQATDESDSISIDTLLARGWPASYIKNRPPGWKPPQRVKQSTGSQELGSPEVIINPAMDPGTRLTEQEFLQIIGALGK